MPDENNITDREAELDEALEESFPASDAPANTVETGIATAASGTRVYENRRASRFEVTQNGELAFLTYERKPDQLIFIHTEVPPTLRGQGIADALASAGLSAARREGLRVVALCPFIKRYLQKHPD